VKDLLVQQGMVNVLYQKQLEGMDNINWQELQARAVETIKLCLDDDVMYHVIDEESSTTVWEKLKS
jgi:uncharacterized circularly permuted ATP-grasp superfamily protein